MENKTVEILEEKEQKYSCVNCESSLTWDDTHEMDGNTYCDICFWDRYCRCEHCEDIELKRDGIFTANGDFVCEGCSSAYYSCWNCGEVYHYDIMSSPSCESDNYYCEDCFTDCFGYCDDCDSDYSTNDYHGCPDCEGSRIYSYDYKPEAIFFGANASNLYLGMELEIAVPNGDKIEISNKAYELYGDMIYCKRDGSVGSGFELVTHPISYNQFNELFNSDKLKELAKLGGRSWDSRNESCGIHIHFSKAAFSKLHLYSFSKLILENPEFFTEFAGRSSTYAEFIYAESSSESLPVAYAKGKSNSRRYLALNNINEDTIEFRIFKGSLNPQRVKRIIELCGALYDYTKLATVKNIIDKKMDLQGFIDYVRKNDLIYPELKTHKQFITEEREAN